MNRTTRNYVLLIAFSGAAVMVGWTVWRAPRDGLARGGTRIEVAVAANFSEPFTEIARCFEARTGYRVTASPGSTGKHYAQIRNGARYAVFLGADAARPALLEEQGAAVGGSRFTYAVGRLVLWSPDAGLVDSAGAVLRGGDFDHLAMANPRHAPYGVAAREVLERLGVWGALQGRIVFGENVGQAQQFVRSGAAELGFVAASQMYGGGRTASGSWWEVPQSLYTPLEQQAILLRESVAGRALIEFMRSDEARQIIREYGYDLP